jgi:hypothetical protein
MSMVATINVTVKNLDILMRALGLLHYRVVADLADERGVLRGRVQQTDTGEILAELCRELTGEYRITNQRLKVDVIEQAGRGNRKAQPMDYSTYNQELRTKVNSILQTYSYLEVLDTLRFENYRVTGTETREGKIVLTVAV